MTVNIRPYADGDKRSIVSLHKDIMDSEHTEELLEWKYFQYPDIDTPRIVLAEKDRQLIGFVGDIRVPLQLRGRPVTARQPTDIMIDDDFRSAKLFMNLVEELRKTFDNDNVVVEFGEPTAETRKIWDRFEAWSFYRQDRKIRIQRPEALLSDVDGIETFTKRLARMAGLPLQSLLYIQDRISRMKAFTSIDDVQKSSGYVSSAFGSPPTDKFPVCLRRDTDFWNWRSNDPQHEMQTYWVGDKSSPNAAVLVGRNYSSNACKIALQETENFESYSELLNIYYKIVLDNRDAATIEAPTNMIGEIPCRAGLTHDRWIDSFSHTSIGAQFASKYDMDFENFNSWTFGWKWYNNTKHIDAVPMSDWEFSPFMTD